MAQVDIFLKLEGGIKGESLDSKHKEEIEVDSFSFGCSQSGSFAVGSGGGAGKVSYQDAHCVSRVSQAGPKLMLACATGEHISKATVTFRKAGKEQQEYLVITLTDCLVSSYQLGGTSGDGVLPTESYSLNFAKCEVQYKPQQASGSLGGVVKAGYDLKQNKAV
ncbi:MAG TPA: type VI secretion system tube protein Hcp [Blastocatellia bacterium]